MEAVKKHNKHLTVEEVYEYISQMYGGASTNEQDRCHSHFTCESCKRVFDAYVDMSDLHHKTEDTQGFDIEDVNIINLSFSGLCWECK